MAEVHGVEDVARQELTAHTVNLPVPVVTTVRECGQARELEATAAELLADLSE